MKVHFRGCYSAGLYTQRVTGKVSGKYVFILIRILVKGPGGSVFVDIGNVPVVVS